MIIPLLRLESSCSNENECISLVYLYETVVIGMYLELNYYAVSIRRYQLDDFIIHSGLILQFQSGKWKKLEWGPYILVCYLDQLACQICKIEATLENSGVQHCLIDTPSRAYLRKYLLTPPMFWILFNERQECLFLWLSYRVSNIEV